MSFLPGCHQRTDVPIHFLTDPQSLFKQWPELEYAERVTLPLRAGDCTFYDGRCPHMANENATDDPRVALSVIMMGRNTRYRKWPHVVSDPLDLAAGEVISGALFPEIPIAAD